MEMIQARNQQVALPKLIRLLYEAEQQDDERVIGDPVVFVFEQPRERLFFWPGLVRNPARELRVALGSLQASEGSLPKAANAIKSNSGQFLFNTPLMAVSGEITKAGRLNMYVVLTDPNPFTGAFGQANLQISIIQELMAQEAKAGVGTLTMQHQKLILASNVVEQLFLAGHKRQDDPYAGGIFGAKVRKIDGPIGMVNLLDKERSTMGLKSKWSRLVAAPLLTADEAETPAQARELAKNIKSSEWRRAMEEWIDAIAQQHAMKEDHA